LVRSATSSTILCSSVSLSALSLSSLRRKAARLRRSASSPRRSRRAAHKETSTIASAVEGMNKAKP